MCFYLIYSNFCVKKEFHKINYWLADYHLIFYNKKQRLMINIPAANSFHLILQYFEQSKNSN
jgi:hypothetical protein